MDADKQCAVNQPRPNAETRYKVKCMLFDGDGQFLEHQSLHYLCAD